MAYTYFPSIFFPFVLRKIQDDPPPSSSVSSDISPDEKVMTDPVKKVHLITPQEFLPIPKASSTINDGAQADISEIGMVYLFYKILYYWCFRTFVIFVLFSRYIFQQQPRQF